MKIINMHKISAGTNKNIDISNHIKYIVDIKHGKGSTN